MTLRHADLPDLGGTCVVCPLIVSGERRSGSQGLIVSAVCVARGTTRSGG